MGKHWAEDLKPGDVVRANLRLIGDWYTITVEVTVNRNPVPTRALYADYNGNLWRIPYKDLIK